MSTKKKLELAIQGLRDIANPIDRLRRNLKPDERLDGIMTVLLLKDPNYYKNIAEDVLKKMEEIK